MNGNFITKQIPYTIGLFQDLNCFTHDTDPSILHPYRNKMLAGYRINVARSTREAGASISNTELIT